MRAPVGSDESNSLVSIIVTAIGLIILMFSRVQTMPFVVGIITTALGIACIFGCAVTASLNTSFIWEKRYESY